MKSVAFSPLVFNPSSLLWLWCGLTGLTKNLVAFFPCEKLYWPSIQIWQKLFQFNLVTFYDILWYLVTVGDFLNGNRTLFHDVSRTNWFREEPINLVRTWHISTSALRLSGHNYRIMPTQQFNLECPSISVSMCLIDRKPITSNPLVVAVNN